MTELDYRDLYVQAMLEVAGAAPGSAWEQPLNPILLKFAQLVADQSKDSGWEDVTKVVPQDYEQVLVTDGTEFRVLHREEGSWAFEVAPCDRTAMKYWKKLVD